MRRVLKNIGSLYLHRDPTARHYLKLWLDAIGGKQSLRNDCLWTYGLGDSAPRVFSKKRDVILFYSKSVDYYFNKPEAERETERRGGRMAEIPSLNDMSRERTGYPMSASGSGVLADQRIAAVQRDAFSTCIMKRSTSS